MQTLPKQPFTTLQLELLRIFSRNISENDLIEIKQLLSQYFAKKAIEQTDSVWDANNWNDKDEEYFLNEHLRTPYKYYFAHSSYEMR